MYTSKMVSYGARKVSFTNLTLDQANLLTHYELLVVDCNQEAEEEGFWSRACARALNDKVELVQTLTELNNYLVSHDLNHSLQNKALVVINRNR